MRKRALLSPSLRTSILPSTVPLYRLASVICQFNHPGLSGSGLLSKAGVSNGNPNRSGPYGELKRL
jgi:hypothetical protein